MPYILSNNIDDLKITFFIIAIFSNLCYLIWRNSPYLAIKPQEKKQVDENRFFREITLKICGSLEMEKALWYCCTYLNKFIPLTSIALATYDFKERITRILAIATEERGQFSSIQIRRSLDIHNQIMAWYHAKEPQQLRMIESLYNDPLTKEVMEKLGNPDSSAMQMFLKLGSVMMGSLFAVRGEMKPYGQKHAHLLSLLNEPFAISLSNYLQYQEVARHKSLLEDDNQYFQSELKRKAGEEIVGADFGLRAVFEQVRQVAPLNSPVLLLGETGTGKEVIAHAIHNLSKRREGPFIQINCGAIPDTLIDSELFGHEKGAFTGATFQQRGRFERAHRGTIFLDEVGELPPDVQIRLLRVLQERYIERVGGEEPIKIDIRVIAATHQDLISMIGRGRFREDLYYRLRVFPIHIPPLRERLSDVPSLIHYFIQKKSQEMGIFDMPTIDPLILKTLINYDWPGNVRELENAVERALILRRGNVLDFSQLYDRSKAGQASRDFSITEAPYFLQENTSELGLDVVTSRHIHRVLELTQGRIHGPAGAAKLLKVNSSTLRGKMIKLGIPFRKGS